jgi:hypothetical protein
MMITHDRVLAEGSKRGNIFDVSALPCFGSVAQNLFTLPVGEEATGDMLLQELSEPVTIAVAEKPFKAKSKSLKEAPAVAKKE